MGEVELRARCSGAPCGHCDDPLLIGVRYGNVAGLALEPIEHIGVCSACGLLSLVKLPYPGAPASAGRVILATADGEFPYSYFCGWEDVAQAILDLRVADGLGPLD